MTFNCRLVCARRAMELRSRWERREVTSSGRSKRWRQGDDAVVGGEGEEVIRAGGRECKRCGSKRERVRVECEEGVGKSFVCFFCDRCPDTNKMKDNCVQQGQADTHPNIPRFSRFSVLSHVIQRSCSVSQVCQLSPLLNATLLCICFATCHHVKIRPDKKYRKRRHTTPKKIIDSYWLLPNVL